VFDRLAQPAAPLVEGAACYLKAELHRLRGEFAKAGEEYRKANQWGREPQPGLALLRLGQGQAEAAKATIRRVLDEARDPVTRSRVLAPYVEIVLASGDVGAARAAADEWSQLAADFDAPLLHALSASSTGAVLLAEGDARAALAGLRGAWKAWQELEAPYEAARVRVLMAQACRGLGDVDTAEMELHAARWVFQQLGAAPDTRTRSGCGSAKRGSGSEPSRPAATTSTSRPRTRTRCASGPRTGSTSTASSRSRRPTTRTICSA